MTAEMLLFAARPLRFRTNGVSCRHCQVVLDLKPGCDYSIKVKSPANESLFDMSDDAFICDGCVRLDDFAVLAGEWPEEQSGLITYLQDNGKVDVNDFAIFAENWTGASRP